MSTKKSKSFEGKLIVITAPSGAGKSTIVRHLLREYENVDFSISATTRRKRKTEKDGVDYYFLSKKKFQKLIDKDSFVEWEEVYKNHYYGTLKSEVKRLWKKKKHIIFDIDVKGAVNIKKLYKKKCLTIFIKPPSLKILIERLKNRKTETPENLKKRIERIKQELLYEAKFDKVIVNDLLEVALKESELILENFLGLNATNYNQ